MINIPISAGELFDKISILEIKKAQIKDPAKLVNIEKELALLLGVAKEIEVDLEDVESLKGVNQKLWGIEDEIRGCERMKDFGSSFIELARSVYITNDERSQIKRRINDQTGSEVTEEKSYANYKP